MPTIRVDNDVYEALRNLGRIGDTFSDALRPLLNLEERKSTNRGRRAAARGSNGQIAHEMIGSGDSETLTEIVSKHLPTHWRDGVMRSRQILFVVDSFLNQPNNLPTTDRHLKAARFAAEKFRVNVNSIRSRCERELFGTGTPNLVGKFRHALERIESDWRKRSTR